MIISDQISYGHLFVVTCYSTNKAWLRSPDYLFYPGIYRVTTGSDPRSRLCLLNQLLDVRKLGLCVSPTQSWILLMHKNHQMNKSQNLEFPPIFLIISSVQSLSRVRLFATPWIAARQTSLSITNSRSSLKLMSIESVMPSSHLILCRPLSDHRSPQFSYSLTLASPAQIVEKLW